MKGAYGSVITWLGVAAIAGLVLGCQETTPATPADPDPPMPTLVGTWEQVTEWDDDDGDIRPVTIKLILTESGKAFWHVDQLELSGEESHDPYGHVADWIATEDTITKTFIHDNDDDDQWESGTIDKSYYLSDSGNVLFVHHWESDEEEDAFERYTRVQDRVPSNPTLLGTWESVGVYHEHDDLLDDYVVAGKEIITLTFTKSRYILVETRRDGDETVDHSHSSGTWTSAMQGIVTKTVADRRADDDGNVIVDDKSFDKEYAWGAGGELFIIRWDDDPDAGETQRPRIERYARVENPLPDSMIGSWAGPRYENIEGTWTFTETWRFILRADDTVTFEVVPEPAYVQVPSPGADPLPPSCFHGTLTIDISELFITFTNTTSNVRDVNAQLFDNKTWRNAYAPTDRRDVIVMSTWWSEQLWPGHALPVEEQIAAVWKDSPWAPYGNYWLTLTREPSSDREPCKW